MEKGLKLQDSRLITTLVYRYHKWSSSPLWRHWMCKWIAKINPACYASGHADTCNKWQEKIKLSFQGLIVAIACDTGNVSFVTSHCLFIFHTYFSGQIVLTVKTEGEHERITQTLELLPWSLRGNVFATVHLNPRNRIKHCSESVPCHVAPSDLQMLSRRTWGWGGSESSTQVCQTGNAYIHPLATYSFVITGIHTSKPHLSSCSRFTLMTVSLYH